MRALVIGADGFVGRHLVAHLDEAGDDIFLGTGPTSAVPADQRRVDVVDPTSVDELVSWAAPDAVYHLAAVAYGPDAARDLSTAVAVTVAGTGNVLAAVERHAPAAHVLVTGSSEVYGDPGPNAVPESGALEPVSLYGATKVGQEAIALAFGRSRGLKVTATRSFNHIGPGQRDSFAIASFAHQLRDAELGRQPPELRVGNLTSVRDFTDVRDVVRAYRALVAGRHAGIAVNVASGRGVAVGDILTKLVHISGVAVDVVVDQARARRTDPPLIVGDARRLHQLTGWRAEIPLDRTLVDIWQDARQRWR